MDVCVVGLGKIGLPVAAQFASKGLEVIGADVSEEVVSGINAGKCHIPEEPELTEKVLSAHKKGLLSATTKTSEAAGRCSVVIIVVPLVVDFGKKPDYRALEAASTAVAKGMKKGTLVVYETTMPIGDTRLRMAPLLERVSGMRAGKDFFLAYSPERVNSNTIFKNLREYPKIVGGINEESAKKAVEFYKKALDSEVINAGSCEAAEFVKLAGMTYRDANIALANEFARVASAFRLDVMKIIGLANTIPHTHILKPGIGVGGHCAPVYPHFLLAKAAERGVELPVVAAARSENDSMHRFALSKLAESLNGFAGKRILLLGIAYREDVKETAFATSLSVISALKGAKAIVYANDPLFSDAEIKAFGADAVSLKSLPQVDAAVLLSNHRAYRELGSTKLAKALANAGAKVLLDGRNAIEPKAARAAGMEYIGIGRQ